MRPADEDEVLEAERAAEEAVRRLAEVGAQLAAAQRRAAAARDRLSRIRRKREQVALDRARTLSQAPMPAQALAPTP